VAIPRLEDIGPDVALRWCALATAWVITIGCMWSMLVSGSLSGGIVAAAGWAMVLRVRTRGRAEIPDEVPSDWEEQTDDY
jgi:hypothetical protein